MTMPVHTVCKMPSKFKGRKARRTVNADDRAATRSHSEFAGQSFVTFGTTRAGMGAGPVLPYLLDLVIKPKT